MTLDHTSTGRISSHAQHVSGLTGAHWKSPQTNKQGMHRRTANTRRHRVFPGTVDSTHKKPFLDSAPVPQNRASQWQPGFSSENSLGRARTLAPGILAVPPFPGWT